MDTPFNSTRDIIIRTEAFEEAVAFYRSVLGLPVVHEEASLVGLETGAFRLYVERGAPHGPVLEFKVADVEAAKSRLQAAGSTVVEEDPSVPRCYVCDPFGLVFNLRRG